MKRLILLAAVLALVLGMASMASAATIKASGQWALEFLFSDNFDMDSEDDGPDGDGDFNVYQRARTQFDFIANENLKGVLATEIGTTRWGSGNAGGTNEGFRFHDHSTAIRVRRAYLDFMVPDTKIAVRGGLQGIALPNSGAFNNSNMILDDEMPALVVSTPIIDEVSVLAGYGRLYDQDDDDSGHSNGSFDTGFLALPVKLDGFQFAPYAVYAYVGHDALKNTDNTPIRANVLWGLATPGATTDVGRNAYWGGTNFVMTYFDPIKVMADVAYGNVSGGGDVNDRSGWMFDLAVDYTGLDFMTPQVFFVYTSGEDDDATNGSERMPALETRNWGIGNGLFFGGDALLSGDHGFFNNQLGFWAAGLSLNKISFLDKLSHDFTAFYAQGTNDKAVAGWVSDSDFIAYGQTLTEEDSIVEFSLNNSYKLYDELTFMANISYDINDYDKDLWGQNKTDDSFKLSTGLLYSF
ncbi:MAG TPA: hypothetical protein DD766_03995 [Desulfovibrio sp.]|nr:hypothetical protein [Desulfovibrio sp.]